MNLIFPEDKEELALTLGGRKRKIKRTDFDQLAVSLGITEIVKNNIYKDFSKQITKVHDLIECSFLTNTYKEGYKSVFEGKMRQVGL